MRPGVHTTELKSYLSTSTLHYHRCWRISHSSFATPNNRSSNKTCLGLFCRLTFRRAYSRLVRVTPLSQKESRHCHQRFLSSTTDPDQNNVGAFSVYANALAFPLCSMPRSLKRIVVHDPLVKLPSVSDPSHVQPLSDNSKQNNSVTAAKVTISLTHCHFQPSFQSCRSPQEGTFVRLGGYVLPHG